MMSVRYDKNGKCTRCGGLGSGFVETDDLCYCLEAEEAVFLGNEEERFWKERWTDEDEAALEQYEEDKSRRLAEQQEY